MIYSFVIATAKSTEHLNMVLLFGLIVFLGTLASRFFQKLHIPQVVGCIFVGIILEDVHIRFYRGG